jgi:DNA helicase II / ATP-dependent DNA helicase PcrA
MIDEYQDTNPTQYRIIRALALRHRNLCVVGDDDQSIYGWRGAEVEHILHFAHDWPDARVIRLEMNYRSREPILALANTLIAHNKTRHPKQLKAHRTGGLPPRFLRFEDETAEAESIAREIAVRSNTETADRVPLSHFAILFRTNEQPRALELALRRERLRYVLIGGQSFFDRKEVRDLVAYLKVFANPSDEPSLLRVINTPARGIGASTLKSLVAFATDRGKPLWDVLPEALNTVELTEAVRARVQGFVDLVERYRARLPTEPLPTVARALVEEIEYKQDVERSYKTPSEIEARLNSVEGVLRSVDEYQARAEAPTLAEFLEQSALSGRDDFGDGKSSREYAITLMTLHSAKGLEFPHVYMVGMEEGLLPHRRVIAEGQSVEEERRLCYVGVTRAQDTLTLSLCKGRVKWGKQRPSVPSRFLLEMRGETEKAARAAEAGEAEVRRSEQARMAAESDGESPKRQRREPGAGVKSPRKIRASAH